MADIRGAVVDIDPARTLLVVGPQITYLCLKEAKGLQSHPKFLSYRSIVESGIKRSLQLEDFTDQNSKDRKEMLLQNAYELEPAFAAHKVVETMLTHHHHDTWITETFADSTDLHFDGQSSRTLQHLMQLRRKGVRIIYTHYDDLLAKALGLPVVLIEDEDKVRKWSQGFPALLHLHGVFTRPKSIRMDCLCYESVVGTGKSADILREQFQSRSVIFLGYDNQFMDPFLPKILSSFTTPTTMPTSSPLLITTSKNSPAINGTLPLLVEPTLNINLILMTASIPLGVAPMSDSTHPVSLQLTCKTTKDIMELLQQVQTVISNGRITQKNYNLFLVDIQTSREALQTIWSLIFAKISANKLNDLTSIELLGSFIIKFYDQNQIMKPINQFVAPFCTTPGGQNPLMKPTAIGTLPHFPLPSSSLLHINVDGQKQLFSQASTLTAKEIQEKTMRRIQSENALEVFQEKQKPLLRKNGFLIHQQSAPTLSPGGLMLAQSNLGTPPSFGDPSLLMSLIKKSQQVKMEKRKEEDKDRHDDNEGNNVSFENKKVEFIKEAQEWSKEVENKITRDDEIDEQTVVVTDLRKTPPTCMPLTRNVLTVQTTPTDTPNSSPQTISTHSPHQLLFKPSNTPTSYIHQIAPTIMNIAKPISSSMLPPTLPLISLPKFTSGDGYCHVRPTCSEGTTPYIYVMQDNRIIATQLYPGATPHSNSYSNNMEGTTGCDVKSEEIKNDSEVNFKKRSRSPNSDGDGYVTPVLKRRKSTSLPDVNHIKSASSPETTPSPTDPAHVNVSFVTLNNNHTPSSHTPPPPIYFNINQPPNGEECTPSADVNNFPPSPHEGTLHPVPPGRGPIQLWQFLLDLLLSSDKSHLIQWTGNGYEFHIVQPEEIAKLWGARKNKPRMNYDKLSRGLRYYYSKGIMDKIPGKKLTFKYTCDIQQYILQNSNVPANTNCVSSSTTTKSL